MARDSSSPSGLPKVTKAKKTQNETNNFLVKFEFQTHTVVITKPDLLSEVSLSLSTLDPLWHTTPVSSLILKHDSPLYHSVLDRQGLAVRLRGRVLASHAKGPVFHPQYD